MRELRSDDPRWRLVVCGEGPLAEALQSRLRELGLEEHAEIRGYVPIDGGLLDLYRSSHAFLHVSLTEGVPQVLIEAFASGVPVVATAVGGVAEAAGDAALLIPPRDASAAAQALAQIAGGAGAARGADRPRPRAGPASHARVRDRAGGRVHLDARTAPGPPAPERFVGLRADPLGGGLGLPRDPQARERAPVSARVRRRARGRGAPPRS